jgi:hypothetical protein
VVYVVRRVMFEVIKRWGREKESTLGNETTYRIKKREKLNGVGGNDGVAG